MKEKTNKYCRNSNRRYFEKDAPIQLKNKVDNSLHKTIFNKSFTKMFY